MLARSIAVLGLLLVAAPVRAQGGPRVLALAPTAPSPDWPAGLAIELAYVGGTVLRTPLAAGTAAEDPVLSARVAAQVVDAEAAVWLSDGGQRVHVALAAADQSFSAPLSGTPDGRTIALVAASLLEEAFATADATSQPLPASVPREQLADPIRPVRQLFDAERPPIHRPLEGGGGSPPEVTAFGAIGTGGLAVFTDVAFDPGTLLRGLFGVRVGPHFQAQANIEVGLFRERIGASLGFELQPFWRICPEAVAVLPASSTVAFQIGAHGCGGTAEVRYYVYDTAFDGFLDYYWGESSVLMLAAGGFLGLELRTSRSTSIVVRADLDGSAPVVTVAGDPVSRQPDAIVSLSAMVGFW